MRFGVRIDRMHANPHRDATQSVEGNFSVPTLTEAARHARGAYPATLVQPGAVRMEPSNRAYGAPEFNPELHPVDGEWYFTHHTSCSLAARLNGDSCLLGTPTVAAELGAGGHLLVDASPYIRERFPAIHTADLETRRIEEGLPDGVYDSALLDPPWYFPDVLLWLETAVRCLRPGGTLLLPLLGEGTRPSAPAERQEILALLESVGEVALLRDEIEYDIPLYEQRALAADGIYLTAPWRLADLVCAQIDSPAELASPQGAELRRAPNDAWSSFRIGSQIVKLREGSRSDRRTPALSPIPGVRSWTLDTVSRRDPRIAKIDLWTSRNRVAGVGDPHSIADLLRELSTGASPSDVSSGNQLAKQLLEILELA